jgi:hypothetical protein
MCGRLRYQSMMIAGPELKPKAIVTALNANPFSVEISPNG